MPDHAAPSGTGALILVVEDSLTQAEMLRHTLTQYGFRVSVVRDGRNALAWLDDNVPDLVITDIVMPVMDGYELCRQMRLRPEHQHVPVILLTSLSDARDVIQGLACGADSFLTKPYDTEQLMYRVQHLLANRERHSPEPPPAALEINFEGDTYLINSGRRQVLDLLISTYETAVRKNKELAQLRRELEAYNAQLQDLVAARTAELQASEHRYRTLMDQANDAIFVADGQTGMLLDANRQAQELVGYSLDEIRTMHQSDLHPPDQKVLYQDIFKENLSRTALIVPNVYVIHRNGWRIPVEISSRVIEIEGRRLVQGIFRDITERKQAEEKIQRQLQRLAALRSIDLAITAAIDLRVTLEVLLGEVVRQLDVHAASVLLLNPHSQMLEYAAGRGFRTRGIESSRVRLGEGQAGRAALERQAIHIPDIAAASPPFFRARLLEQEGFITYYTIPLIAKGQVKGVLDIFHRAPLNPNEDWLDFLEALAGQAAIAVDNASMFDALQRSHTELSLAYDATITGWSRALDLRDKETEGHSQRVTNMALDLARQLGVAETALEHVRRGALLHDIGKMGIPDSILLKPGPLTDDEWAIMRRHPVYAYELLSPIAYLRPALDIPYYHHEKWDGSGYPRGLRGTDIPLPARIFAVVDVWDALQSDRPYRPRWPVEQTLAHIQKQAGAHFDPEVVAAFLRPMPREQPAAAD